MGLEWQGCCYLSGGWTEAGNGEEYSPMGGDRGWMGTESNNARVEAGYRAGPFSDVPTYYTYLNFSCCQRLR